MPGRRPTPHKVPPPTIVLLVRHGRTPTTGTILPGRARGLHLSEGGQAQAEAVAERIGALAGTPDSPVAVYASPLERTRETARPIAERLSVPVTSDKGLIECDFGQWTGGDLKKLAKLPEWQTIQRFPSAFRFPGGESFPEMQARMVGALSRLAAAHAGKAIVCVSHADTIKAAVAAAAGVPLDLFQRLTVSPCSVTALAYSPTGAHVLCVNSTGSLTDLALS